jgi:hypothetical protein
MSTNESLPLLWGAVGTPSTAPHDSPEAPLPLPSAAPPKVPASIKLNAVFQLPLFPEGDRG